LLGKRLALELEVEVEHLVPGNGSRGAEEQRRAEFNGCDGDQKDEVTGGAGELAQRGLPPSPTAKARADSPATTDSQGEHSARTNPRWVMSPS
jgi:hypothetical protein